MALQIRKHSTCVQALPCPSPALLRRATSPALAGRGEAPDAKISTRSQEHKGARHEHPLQADQAGDHHRTAALVAQDLRDAGRAPDLRVPMREIMLSEGAGEPNLPVYDTSGPYTDNNVAIDVNKGLPRTRQNGCRSAAASRNTTAATSSRKTTAMSAHRMPPQPSRPTTSRCAASATRRSPSSSSPAPASSPRR